MTDEANRNKLMESVKRMSIPILGFVFLLLVARLLFPQGGSGEDVDTGRERQRAYAKSKEAATDRVKLPSYRLESLLAIDPFQPMANKTTVAQKESIESDTDNMTLASDGNPADEPNEPVAIQAIIQDASGTAALLGSSIVREGDPWQQGYRVHRITAEGIFLIKTE
jgi:hypothetical protein